jgi:hypothetical protein
MLRLDLIPPGRMIPGAESRWYAAFDRPIFQLLERKEVDGSPAPQLVLASLPDRGIRVYEPLKERGLFLTFADTPPTAEGIVQFANRYGPLGFPARITVVAQETSDYEASIFYPNETLQEQKRLLLNPHYGAPQMEAIVAWKNEIVWMRHLTQLWQATQADWKLLRRNIIWQGDKIIHRWEPTEQRDEEESDPRSKGEAIWDDTVLRAPDGSMFFRRGELAGPALYFVMRAVNQRIGDAVHPQLCWSIERHRPELLYREEVGLLGAMYWEFAQALDKGWKYRQCPICRKSFQLAPGENRTNRLTCSNTCRTYLYRQRMDEARQLRQQGQSPAAIAKKLNTTVATVKKWIAKEQ